jgi:uncharacterized damage-inducible protein DinB
MEALLDTWRISARLNLYLLDNIPEDQLPTKLAKGKSVVANFTHIHNVRLMWLKASAPDLLETQRKFEESDGVGRDALKEALESSAAAIEELISRAGSPEGRVKNFKPHAAGFVGYMIAHEAFHRTCAELALRQAGTPLSDKVSYGVWEWGSR